MPPTLLPVQGEEETVEKEKETKQKLRRQERSGIPNYQVMNVDEDIVDSGCNVEVIIDGEVM